MMKYRIEISEEQRLLIYSALSLMLTYKGMSVATRTTTQNLREELDVLPGNHAAINNHPTYTHDLT